MGSFRPIDANPALTLNFDKWAEGQSFHGFHKIHLNNSVQDPTLLSEKIARDMFNAAGIPTPRAAHATVTLNERDLGVYVMVEGINKQFLKKHFENAQGNLYDGGQARDISSRLQKSSGDASPDWSDLRSLTYAASAEVSKRTARLERVLDLDRFITLLAMEIMIWHWDGYALNQNNYRVYHNPASDKLVFLPHGLDQAFRMTEGPIAPGMRGSVARAVMEVPELRQRYLQRMSELFTNVFHYEQITNDAFRVAQKIEELKAEKNPRAAQVYRHQTREFLSRISARAKSVERQFSRPNKPLQFDQAGKAIPTGWRAKVDVGSPVFTEEVDANKKSQLHFQTAEATVCSWRTQVLLESGVYRFSGKVRTRGVTTNPNDPRSRGAALRLSGRGGGQPLSGDHAWTEMSFDFPVTDSPGAVELVCEFRAGKGEVWFDADSLRLTRLGSFSGRDGNFSPFR